MKSKYQFWQRVFTDIQDGEVIMCPGVRRKFEEECLVWSSPEKEGTKQQEKSFRDLKSWSRGSSFTVVPSCTHRMKIHKDMQNSGQAQCSGLLLGSSLPHGLCTCTMYVITTAVMGISLKLT